jgi:hypothetical protein
MATNIMFLQLIMPHKLTKNSIGFKIIPILTLLVLILLSGCSSGNDNQSYQYQQKYAPAPAQRQNYYAPQPSYVNSPYQYQQPASRYYSNPYAMPPQNQYPYYDGDQYYVPPTYYGIPNTDNKPASSFNQKF